MALECWATIGSTNRDTRSFALNADLTYSRKVDYAQWRGRGLFNRLLELLSLPVRDQF
jgi:hypothetical protein